MSKDEKYWRRFKTQNAIYFELGRAGTLHPNWPTDIVHQTAIMVEEAGETLRAALNVADHNGDIEEVRKEAIQTAAMCIRLLENMEWEDGE